LHRKALVVNLLNFYCKIREIGLSSETILLDELIKKFREKTGLSIRKISVISGVNKDRINKIIKT
jgi:hypothetical protein